MPNLTPGEEMYVVSFRSYLLSWCLKREEVLFLDEGKRIFVITILVEDREKAYSKVNDVLHAYADHILLRVGYPIHAENISVIFIVLKGDTDLLGGLSGKLGQRDGVKVRSMVVGR